MILRVYKFVKNQIFQLKMSEGKRLDYWSEKWTAGSTGWHNVDINYAIRNHGKRLLTAPARRVFVPLCGKSVDVKWFYDGGHSVVGVDGVEKAVVEFFEESNISYVTETLPCGKLFKTEDDRLRIYVCDLFNVDVEVIGKFDAVWDRGSLVAIYKEDRERYAKLLKSVLKPDFRYLLSTVIYGDNPVFTGPPRSVPPEMIQQLFGDLCQMEEMESEEWALDDPRLVRYGVERMRETVTLLSPKT